MSTYSVEWSLSGESSRIVERYCPNCGKTVVFTDSGKVRRNANGKDIYAFAIYKCPREHTWNRKIEGDPLLNGSDPDAKWGGGSFEMTVLSELRVLGFTELRAVVRGAAGERLDRALSARLVGVSRTEWQKRIEEGTVTVDGKRVKAGYLVRGESVVMVQL